MSFKVIFVISNFLVNLRKNKLYTRSTGPHCFEIVFRAVLNYNKIAKKDLFSTLAIFKISSLKFIYFTIKQEIKEL